MKHFFVKWLVVGLILFLLFRLILWVITSGMDVPQFADVRQQTNSSYTHILDRQGYTVESIRQDFTVRKVDWVALEDYSSAIQQFVLLSEDKRFFEHGGVDWFALANAIKTKLLGQTQRGASTITMQLVGMLIPELQRQKQQRSYQQKLQQLLYAQALESQWSKEEILEAYLNLVPLRGEVVGMAAGAQTFFQKYPHAITRQEAALLAAMLRAPNAPLDVLTQRTCILMNQEECEYLPRFVSNSLKNPKAFLLDSAKDAPHFARQVVFAYQKQQKALNQDTSLPDSIISTMDHRLQQFVKSRVHARLVELFQERVSDAAVVVLDNRNGEVLAYVGSSAKLSDAPYVDHAQALRQAGSTLKPFLYAMAFDRKKLTAASLLNDDVLSIAVDTGLYIPQNYDRDFKGWVSVRTALASSLNIPAVQTLTMLGAEAFRNLLLSFGLPLPERGSYYGYSLALGSADVTLLSLTNAYRTLANLGHYTEVKWLRNNNPLPQEERQVALSPASMWIVGDILSDRIARALTFGLDSALSTPFKTAVKTGTSKDMRDNWTVGWSSHYTVGVWVGNSAGGSMRNVSGVSGAAPIWHDVMKYLHEDLPSEFPTMPEQVVKQTIEYDPRVEPSRVEYFVKGTEMPIIRLASNLDLNQGKASFIANPTDGTIIALDPDIPRENQRLRLEAKQFNQRLARGVIWYLNGRELSHENPYYLPLTIGRHQLELYNTEGKKLDQVSFQVRGTR